MRYIYTNTNLDLKYTCTFNVIAIVIYIAPLLEKAQEVAQLDYPRPRTWRMVFDYLQNRGMKRKSLSQIAWKLLKNQRPNKEKLLCCIVALYISEQPDHPV